MQRGCSTKRDIRINYYTESTEVYCGKDHSNMRQKIVYQIVS